MFTLRGYSTAGPSHRQCVSVGRLERLRHCRWARSCPAPECCGEEPPIGMALKITHTNIQKGSDKILVKDASTMLTAFC